MSKIYSRILLGIFALATGIVAEGQVSVTATAGTTGPTAYSNLSSAFTAINAGTHQGDITVDITASFTDAAVSVLNSSGAGSASYTSVLVRPTADAVTMSFATATGRGVIELNGADNVTIDGDNPNTAGINRNLSITNTATNTITFTSVIRLATSTLITSANNITIRNLNLTGSGTNRNTSAFTSETTTWGVIASAGASTVAATTAPSALASATTTVPSTQTHTNLVIQNNNIQSVSRGISTNGAAATVAVGLLVEDNLIGNPTIGATDQVTAVGITIQGTTNGIIRGNTVRVEGFIGSSTPNRAINVGMVSTTGLSGAIIEGNSVERMYNNNTATWPATGIDVSGGTNHIIRNNFVTNVLNNQVAGTGAFGTSFAAYGIRIIAGTGHSIIHNSVHLSGAMPGVISTNITASLTIVSTTSTGMDIRNNIFSNMVTGGNPTGTRNVAIALPSGATSAMNLLLNNNAYVAGTDANNRLAQVGFTFGTGEYQVSDFNPGAVTPAANLRSYTSTLSGTGTNDNASIAVSTALPFVSNTDLHIPNGTPTFLESTGAATSVLTDIDSDPRNASTPDMGADEFAGIFVDPIAPSITYSTLPNTLCTGAATLSATITDFLSGVNTSVGTAPRIYFRKSSNLNVLPATNDNTTNGWKYAEASNTSSPFQLTINPALIFGGVATGDVIEYFVVAQDMASTPNVAINSGSFAVPASSVALTGANFPVTGTINSYSILAGISGTVTIGAAGTYPNLTGAGGLFAAINANGLSGNMIAEILDASVTEPGTNALNPVAYGCATTSTLTIRPAAGVTTTLTGNLASNALIRIYASNVTIDGSNNGSSTRDMTITNTATTGPTVINIASTGTVPVTNDQLKNTIIINGANVASAIVISDDVVGQPGYFNNITIQNNSVQRAYIGMYNNAAIVPGNGSGLQIIGNELNTAGAMSIRLAGIYLQGIDGAVVSNNTVGNMANTADASNLTGIWAATGTVNTTFSGNTIATMSGTSTAPRGIVVSSGDANANIQVVNNTISGLTSSSTATTTGIFVFGTTENVSVRDNKVSNIKNTNTSGFGSNGIQLGSTSTDADISVVNNFVFDVAADGFNGRAVGDNGYGIIVTAGAGYDIHFNTVLLNTNQVEVGGLPSAFHVTSGVTVAGAINLTNNIFVNTQTVGTNRYAITSSAANTVFGTINYNDYYATGANLGFIGSNRADLAAVQAGFGGNLNSINYLPSFVSATDLHLTNAPGDNWCLESAGITVTGITVDIDGDTRQVGTAPMGPDMGADEFNAAGFVINNPAAICDGSSVDLTAAAITAGSMGGLTFEYYTDAAATNVLANPNAVTAAGTYYIKAINGTCFIVRPVVVSVNPVPTVSGVLVQPTTCVSTDGSITLTLGGAVGPYTFAWTGTGVNPSAQDQVNLGVGSYTVLVTAANGCTATEVFNLPGPGGCNICPTIPTLTTTPAGTTCVGANTTFTASGLTDMGVTYGVTFKYSASVLADPYSGGTVLATVNNASLTSGNTEAIATASFPATGNYIVYAILSPTPIDPLCRPFAQVNITVNSAPTVTCPANITVNNDLNQCGAVVNYPAAIVTGTPAPTVVYSVPSGSLFPVGTTTVTVTATNGCGVATCTFDVTVNDTQNPVITCPANITASNAAGLCSATVNTPNPTATDNCSGFVVTWALTGATTGSSPATGVNFVGSRSFNVGVTTVTYTIRDASNNTATCSFTVTVNDTQAPTVSCPANITASNAPNTCSASVATPNPTNSDNCGVTIRTWAMTGATTGASPATGLNNVGTQTFNVGVTTVTYTVRDAAGNTGTCSFTVTVNDTQAPAITCPANITVTTPLGLCTAVVNYTVTATDNCPGVTTSLSSGLASGSAFPIGVTTVTHTATDASGNTSSCSFTVTVLDGQLPVISSQPVNVTTCVGGTATFSVTATNAVSYQWQMFSGGSWNNVAGATASSYTVNNATTAMNTNTFRVIVTGLCTSVTSGSATMFVNTLPIITLHPSISPALIPGQVLSITATGMPPGGTYQWFKDGVLIPGVTGNVLSGLTVSDIGSYTVRYTAPTGCQSISAPLEVTGHPSGNVWVFPNPNHGQFQVRVFTTGTVSPITIRVYDAKGSLVYEKQHATALPYTMMEVNLNAAGSNGTYVVRVHDGSGKMIGSQLVVVRN